MYFEYLLIGVLRNLYCIQFSSFILENKNIYHIKVPTYINRKKVVLKYLYKAQKGTNYFENYIRFSKCLYEYLVKVSFI